MAPFVRLLGISSVKYVRRLRDVISLELAYPIQGNSEELFLHILGALETFFRMFEGPSNEFPEWFLIIMKFLCSNFQHITQNEAFPVLLQSILQQMFANDRKLSVQLYHATTDVVENQEIVSFLERMELC
ncbi:hypothetical protein HDE_10312 [Halotydeus destructor]|nr:hypothetical protein HDE_10312 [Halotydeus destructor]